MDDDWMKCKTGCVVDGPHRVPIDCVTPTELYLYHTIDKMRPVYDAAMALLPLIDNDEIELSVTSKILAYQPYEVWDKAEGLIEAFLVACRTAEEVERG